MILIVHVQYFKCLFVGAFLNPISVTAQLVPTSTGFAFVPAYVAPPISALNPTTTGFAPTAAVTTAPTYSSPSASSYLSTGMGALTTASTGMSTSSITSATGMQSAPTGTTQGAGYFTPPHSIPPATSTSNDPLSSSPAMQSFVAKTKERKHMRAYRASSEG